MLRRLQMLQGWRRSSSRTSSDHSDSEFEESRRANAQRVLMLGDVDVSNTHVKQLHSAAMHGRKKDIQTVLTTGVNVDFPNDAGQTALFCATLRGKYSAVELLLQYGANPNEKSEAGITPVHVACYKASLRALGAMVEAGGDLRLHDNEGNSCVDWAKSHPDPKKRIKMLEFLQRSQMFALSYIGDFVGCTNRQPSILKMLRGKVGSQMSLDVSQESGLRRVESHGYGQVYCQESASGVVSVIPLIMESQLQADTDGISFDSTLYFTMTSMMWGMTAVTVKKLDVQKAQGRHTLDLLISEAEHHRKLRHPNLLLLMGLSQSSNFDNLLLIFERVNIGSLHYILHEKLDHLPMTYIRDIACQVSQALLYIHGQNYVHCGLSSHAVLMVSMHQAKLGGLEYMMQMKKSQTGRSCLVATSPHREHLFRWMAPEVIAGDLPSLPSDVYSFSCILWEMVTSKLPWESASATVVLEKHKAGTAELPSPPKCVELFQEIMKQGLGQDPRTRPQDFVTLFRLLQGPLDKPLGFKLDCRGRLKALKKESAERISVQSGYSSLFGGLCQGSNDSECSGGSSCMVLPAQTSSSAHSVGEGADSAQQTEDRADSDSTNNHSAIALPHSPDDGSALLGHGEDSLDFDFQDGYRADKNQHEARGRKLTEQKLGQIKLPHLTGPGRYQSERTSSLPTVGRAQKSARRKALLPWQGSLGLLRAGSPSQRLSRSPRKNASPDDKTTMDIDQLANKVLPPVKPASHSTDIQYFTRDQGSMTRTMSTHRSLPRMGNSQLITPSTFPRSRSAAGDVIGTDHKDVELSTPGSVRTLTEQFQAQLYNHTLRQNILMGSRMPHGTLFNDLDTWPTCMKRSPNVSEVPPEGNRDDDLGSPNKDELTGSTKGSSESLTSVSFREESLLDDDDGDEQGLPLSSRNELDISHQPSLPKPAPLYPRCSTQMQNVSATAVQSPGMFQEQSAFRVVNIELSSSLHGQDCSDTHAEPNNSTQFLPSCIPGTDISTHPFDFHDYYIDDEYTAVCEEDPTGLQRCKTAGQDRRQAAKRSRRRTREVVWHRDSQHRRNYRPEQEEGEEGIIEYGRWVCEQKEAEENWEQNRSKLRQTTTPPVQSRDEVHNSYVKQDQWLEDQWQEESTPGGTDGHTTESQTFQIAGKSTSSTGSASRREILPIVEDLQFEDRGWKTRNTKKLSRGTAIWSNDGESDRCGGGEEKWRNLSTEAVLGKDENTDDNTRRGEEQASGAASAEDDRDTGDDQELDIYRQDQLDANVHRSTSSQFPTPDVSYVAESLLYPRCISTLSTSSVSTVVQRPAQDTWDGPVRDDEEEADEDDNDRTLTAGDRSDQRRCILLNLERNVSSPEDMDKDARISEDAAEEADPGRTGVQSTLRKFYLGPSTGSQGYTTTLRVESSLQRPGTHRITHTARDSSTGRTTTVHQETLQASTLRTTMGVQ